MVVDLSEQLFSFTNYLIGFRKIEALNYCMNLLAHNEISIPALYEQILAPALNQIVLERKEEDHLIWKEHVMTNIVRNIIEASFPYVLQGKEDRFIKQENPTIILTSPEEEYHEIGLRMGADFFTMQGFDVIYIGCNTPLSNILSAVRVIRPKFLDISITNYLNLVSLKNITSAIRDMENIEMKIILSGSAFHRGQYQPEDFGAYKVINSYQDVVTLRKEYDEISL